MDLILSKARGYVLGGFESRLDDTLLVRTPIDGYYEPSNPRNLESLGGK